MTKHHYATGALQHSFALILSILFTEKLVRFIFFKFHCYFNQHKMSALAAFVMPLFLLFTTIFVKLNNKKKQRLKTKLSLLYPHITSPFGSLANVIRILLQSVYLITFNVTTKDAPSRNEHKKATARLINRVFRAIRYMDSKLTRRCKKLWLQLQLKLNNKTNVKPLQRVNSFNLWQNRILKFVFYFMFAFTILLFVTVPFSLEAQAIFISLILIVA
ncbi:MAG: UDP-forming cellulose synthase catalytic subunit, partial [Pseudoalteromonas sp.]